jgi:hypothetical protein
MPHPTGPSPGAWSRGRRSGCRCRCWPPSATSCRSPRPTSSPRPPRTSPSARRRGRRAAGRPPTCPRSGPSERGFSPKHERPAVDARAGRALVQADVRPLWSTRIRRSPLAGGSTVPDVLLTCARHVRPLRGLWRRADGPWPGCRRRTAVHRVRRHPRRLLLPPLPCRGAPVQPRALPRLLSRRATRGVAGRRQRERPSGAAAALPGRTDDAEPVERSHLAPQAAGAGAAPRTRKWGGPAHARGAGSAAELAHRGLPARAAHELRCAAAVDKHLLLFERWLDERLSHAEHPDHVRLLQQFATWHVLRRLRGRAERGLSVPRRPTRLVSRSTRPPRSSPGWAAAVGHSLTAPRPTWTPGMPSSSPPGARLRRSCAGPWASTGCRGSSCRPGPPATRPPITQERRLDLIRQLLTDPDGPLRERVAGLLLLLYAQPVSRIVRLTLDDVSHVDGQVLLRLGDPPVPVPAPLAGLLHALIDNRTNMATATNRDARWLFPGRRAGQPMLPRSLGPALRAHGIPVQSGRTAAIRQLVLQAPAPVVAGMLGLHTRPPPGSSWRRAGPGAAMPLATTVGERDLDVVARAARPGLPLSRRRAARGHRVQRRLLSRPDLLSLWLATSRTGSSTSSASTPPVRTPTGISSARSTMPRLSRRNWILPRQRS